MYKTNPLSVSSAKNRYYSEPFFSLCSTHNRVSSDLCKPNNKSPDVGVRLKITAAAYGKQYTRDFCVFFQIYMSPTTISTI